MVVDIHTMIIATLKAVISIPDPNYAYRAKGNLITRTGTLITRTWWILITRTMHNYPIFVVEDKAWWYLTTDHGCCRRTTMVVVDDGPWPLSKTNHGRCRRQTISVVEDEPWSLSKTNNGSCRRRTLVVVEGGP